MLLPKKTKYRKYQRGRRRGASKGQTNVQAGDFGLKALEAAWVTNRQIEAARIAMTRKIRRAGAAREGSAAPGRAEAAAEDQGRTTGGGSLCELKTCAI